MSMDNAAALVKIFAGEIERQDTPQNGDYIENGILFCGKCRTVKRRMLEFHGEDLIVPIMCECSARADEELRRQSEAAQANARTAQLRYLSMMDCAHGIPKSVHMKAVNIFTEKFKHGHL